MDLRGKCDWMDCNGLGTAIFGQIMMIFVSFEHVTLTAFQENKTIFSLRSWKDW